MKIIAAMFLSAGILVSAQPAMALEPWHDYYTAKWAKEKAKIEKEKAKQAASKVDSRRDPVAK